MILIDPPLWPARGRVWSHMVSDVSHEELHAFAAGVGLPRRAFERDHYDVPADLYERAVSLGAEPVGCRELLARLMDAGLRRRRPRAGRAAGSGRESGIEQEELGLDVVPGAGLQAPVGLGHPEDHR